MRVTLQPHYEKVARLFNGADAIYPGVVLMTRVDCAMKVLGAIFHFSVSLTSSCGSCEFKIGACIILSF